MKPLSLATVFSVGASAATSDRCQPQNCTDVHVFLVRGTSEAYPGDSISIAKAICNDWKDYPESEVGQKRERFQSSWPREGKQLESLNRWTKVLRDYCNMEDPACAGGDDWTAHTSYFKLYSVDAAQFVRFALCS
ncbi:hypothetical protein BHE90_001360 [Fusarium euwallaceae]|uniref:Uncharacterized protein n=1 Tax=Fusarium euwallaceae TaxID=1147111 RepID=A0A430M7W1_9HYPO|nr:hypothetical protein BHE90_001360 [Fusarium euwallaceae]